MKSWLSRVTSACIQMVKAVHHTGFERPLRGT